MQFPDLREFDGNADAAVRPASLGSELVRTGAITSEQLMAALSVQAQCDATLDKILTAEGIMRPADMRAALAQFHDTFVVDLDETPADGTLLHLLDPQYCIKHSIIAWQKMDGVTHIATSRPHLFQQIVAALPDELLPARMVIASQEQIQKTVARMNRPALVLAAQTRVPEAESCRTWGKTRTLRITLCLIALIGIAALTFSFPKVVFAALVGWAIFTLMISSIMKTAAFVARVSRPPEDFLTPEMPTGARLPKVSVLVPLFKEKEIATHLVQRLKKLNYPKSLLDVVLVLEEVDSLTQETVARTSLPPWIRVVVVPKGTPQTKPRAMNYALDFCEGEIIGIFDAEDAPDADQITRVAHHFLNAPPDLVCLQGILDYYNPRQNWIARCFTIEYAAWFRLILPGMAQLGFGIPLGGTTLYFRRDALEELGGWDAHNVTEDADLGFRLARHGYRTDVIQTVTGEEANCRALPWVRQRSRWLKGYMITYLVHMRKPLKLFNQLGAWRFIGFQAHFVTAMSQFFLAPLLWSFWLVILGIHHPLDGIVPHEMLITMGSLFLTVEMINVVANLTAIANPGHRHLLPWVATMHVYYPLGVFAAYKALYELIVIPFYWDKTQHGLSIDHPKGADQPPKARRGR
ncbi:MAG: glycosyltransferase family 2 protein [Paracoccaceae bacterium]